MDPTHVVPDHLSQRPDDATVNKPDEPFYDRSDHRSDSDPTDDPMSDSTTTDAKVELNIKSLLF